MSLSCPDWPVLRQATPCAKLVLTAGRAIRLDAVECWASSTAFISRDVRPAFVRAST